MHKKFNHQEIEKKWQQVWRDSGIYDVDLESADESKEKEYVLVEWPYPSGNLHIGHWFAFAVVDMYVRARRMQGKNVFFPIGFDAFGLPAENAAIKNGIDPKSWTDSNIAYMRKQLESMGNAFSWNHSTSSIDSEYYKWTQWMFTQFFEKGIAYRGMGVVNWCPGCKTVIANEQVLSDGTCERSGDHILRKEMPQWMLRITDYANRLIDDLDTLDWPPYIKEAQRQWIGRSKGAEINFLLNFKYNPQNNENRGPNGERAQIPVFTTRPDTLFGATYLVLAPEHPWVTLATDGQHDVLSNKIEILNYVQIAKQKDDIERTNINKEKTGIKIEGVVAINPATGLEIPIFVADYVLSGYGTGAIMGVPAHDERDFEFAQKFTLPVQQVVVPCSNDLDNPPQEGLEEVKRDTVIVHLKDISTGKYALLNWHGTLEGTTTAIMGGIEAGQTPEEAAYAEIYEEAALKGVIIIKKLPWVTGSRYCASHKNQNRCAHTYAFLAEIKDLTSQGQISEKERKLHTLVWVHESEVLKSLTPDHQKSVWKLLNQETKPLIASGYLINSGEFDDMDSEVAKEKIALKFDGKIVNTYRLRDWSIGRQRYWGVPIPVVYDPEGKPHSISKEHLPWHLPTDVDFTPTGEAPLAKSVELQERVERIFGKGWTPEVETMDTFVDSSWYFLRYLDPRDPTQLSSLELQKQWMPVDVYFGGSEHTTMHLLYSRFWQKVLYDLGLVTNHEPYKKRINRGLVLGPDGNKMSKSKGNVIDPDKQVLQLGADAVRMYLAFMGPYAEPSNYPWDIGGIVGIRRFLERVYGLKEHIAETENAETSRLLHKTIDKVTRDIALYKFNTAISALMIFINQAEKNGLTQISYQLFLQLLAPFAPHLSEELWHLLEKKNSIHAETWPIPDSAYLQDDTVTISVQIDGKMRGTIIIRINSTESDVIAQIKNENAFSERLQSGIEKVFFVPGKIINILTHNT